MRLPMLQTLKDMSTGEEANPAALFFFAGVS